MNIHPSKASLQYSALHPAGAVLHRPRRPEGLGLMTGMGHEERFPPPRLSACCGFRKETIAGMRRNGRDAP